jgi:sugar phosphate permease
MKVSAAAPCQCSSPGRADDGVAGADAEHGPVPDPDEPHALLPAVLAGVAFVVVQARGAHPPTTAVLLDAVPAGRAGTASAVFNTSRQIGGALAVAVFGALLASTGGFVVGLRLSLIIAAVVAALVAATATRLTPTRPTATR